MFPKYASMGRDRPAIGSSATIVNGASFLPGIVAGSWVTIAGANLSGTTRSWGADDFVDGKLPTQLDGVGVKIASQDAAVYFVSPGQINALAPVNLAPGMVWVEVIRAGLRSEPVLAEVKAFAPGLFTYSAGGQLFVAAVHPDGKLVGNPDLVDARLAKPDDHIALYGTGVGPSPVFDLVTPFALTTQPVTATIGNATATVEFAGYTEPGLAQVNVVIPQLPPGNYEVMVEIAGRRSQARVLMAIGQ
jgi:uncharacterized protein (TIGR03437 family)